MNINTPLKTLPLLAVLAVGLVLSPTLSMAGNGDRGHHKEKYSHDIGKSHSKGHNKVQHRSNKHSVKTHGKSHKDNHSHRSERHYSKGHGHYNKHAYYKRGHHKHGYDHHKHYRGHSHTHYIVNDHYYSDGLFDLDNLRFMIGLHTNNLDITFRD